MTNAQYLIAGIFLYGIIAEASLIHDSYAAQMYTQQEKYQQCVIQDYGSIPYQPSNYYSKCI